MIFNNEYQSLWTGYRDPDPNDTISYLQHYLVLFHNNKDTFLKYQASKTVKKNTTIFANGLMPFIIPEREKSITKVQITERKKVDTIEHKVKKEEYMLENSNYNIPKVYLISHFSEVIPEFGSLS